VSRDLPDLFRFLMATGCRIGEALAVRWGDVNLDRATLVINGNIVPVRGKGLVRHSGKTAAAVRTVPLAEFLVTMLWMRLSPETTPTEPVFTNTKLSWRDPGQAGKWIRQARDAAGYPWLSSHVFRETAATILDEQRFSPREIANVLGHSRPSLTQDVYMHRGAANPAAGAALNEALRPRTA
jgi:integrase